jgi:uncharacterized protein (DUF1800 family)
MAWTAEERRAHILRKFGFGASYMELEKLKSLDEPKLIIGLTSRVPDADIHPFRFAYKEGGEDAEPGSYRFRIWWTAQMVLNLNPLQERLSVFWHDHFAVSDGKVEDGLMMLDYFKAIRATPFGKFKDILRIVVTQPAFLKYLDIRIVGKKTPNENFARELLELYTLGIGNYSEHDIKEVARAFTGWGYLNTYYEMEATANDKLRYAEMHEQPFGVFAVFPTQVDAGPKEMLGWKGNLDAGTVLDKLAADPRTARHICGKLWEFFVYEAPEDSVLEKAAAVWKKTDGEIGAVLRAFVDFPEFWSERAVKGVIKNPVDYSVGLCRALAVDYKLRASVKMGERFDKPIEKETFDQLGALIYYIGLMGMNIGYPDDVSGWTWGAGWATENTMLRRMQFRGVWTWKKVQDKPEEKYMPDTPTQVLIQYMTPHADKPPLEQADIFLKFFDGRMGEGGKAALAKYFEATNLKAAFVKEDVCGWILTEGIRLMVAAPEFHSQ